MAVANTKSTGITNSDASPMVRSKRVLIEGGPVLSSIGTIEVSADDEDGSVYRFARVQI